MKKVILKVHLRDETAKQKAMTAVSGDLKGVDSISIDMDAQEMTVIGEINPVNVVNKLKELCNCEAEIVSVVPVEKPGNSSKNTKEEPKKDKELKEEPTKEEPKKDDVARLVSAYQAYNPYSSSSSKE